MQHKKMISPKKGIQKDNLEMHDSTQVTQNKQSLIQAYLLI